MVRLSLRLEKLSTGEAALLGERLIVPDLTRDKRVGTPNCRDFRGLQAIWG
jgi:hypothetical protein